jgi:hypothetical protein
MPFLRTFYSLASLRDNPEHAGYSSAVVAEFDGVQQYVQVVGRGVVGVATDTGKFL